MHEWIIGLVVTAVVAACLPLRGARGDVYADAPAADATGADRPEAGATPSRADRPATAATPLGAAVPRRRVVRSTRRRRRGGSRPANRGIARL